MRYLFLFILVLGIRANYGQEVSEQQSVWFAYNGLYKVSKNFGYHIEAQFRMDNDLGQSQQNLYRLGLIYYFKKPTNNLTAGYALIKTYNVTADDYLHENRIWQQYQTAHKWKNNTMIHRFRLEERFAERFYSTGNETEFQLRFRYFNRNLFHLKDIMEKQGELYVVLQDELFVTMHDNNLNTNFVDQNRFLVGLGLYYHKNIRFEVGYLNHLITSSRNNDIMRHTISLFLLHTLDFKNLK